MEYSNVTSRRGVETETPMVVVADRYLDNLKIISFVLDYLNVKYCLAEDGKAALDLINDKLPNLALLDVEMPYINGIEVNLIIKNNLFTKHIQTLATTELVNRECITAISSFKFDDYIIKPFSIEDLENKLKHLLKIN